MRTHTVQKNETLDSIAKKYGLPHGGLVYNAPCNSNFRRLRPNPNQLKVGDVINIPANAVEETQRKLSNLLKIKADFLAMNEQMLNEWKGEYGKVKNTAASVDIAKTLIDIAGGITGIVKLGFKAMKLSGQLLEKANKELAWSAIKFGYDPIKKVAKDTAAEHFTKVNNDDGMIKALGKDALHFFLVDWDTPSYWTAKITGVDVEEVNNRVTRDIELQRTNGIKRLDAEIAKTQATLVQLKNAHYGKIMGAVYP